MNLVTTVESDACHITKVFTSWSVAETNRYLKKGWILLHSGIAHKDPGGFHSEPCWMLGKIQHNN